MIKIIALPSGIEYNNAYKIVVPEPSLKVRFVESAKRSKKHTNYRRRGESYPLWWNRSGSTVLQKTETQMASATSSKIFPTFQSLSSYRTYFSDYLCLNCWYTPLEENKNPSRQWFLSTNHWPPKLPLCQQFEAFPETNKSRQHPRYYQSQRLSQAKDILHPIPKNQFALRSRFFCYHSLWQIYRRSQNRLQSWQKGCPFLSSSILLRSQFQRFLAQYLKTWRYRFFNQSSRIFQRMLKQDSSLYLSLQSKSRCGFLQSQTYQTSRGEKYWLCNCCQNYQTHQMAIGRSALSPIQKILGSGRIPLHPPQLEKASQIYSYPQTTSRKRFRPTNSFHHKAILLSSFRNQSPFKFRKCLVFLSWPSTYRKIHQRIKRKFCSGQNPYQQFSGKSVLFSSITFRLQHRQLVQEDMSASKISQCHPRDYSYRIFSDSSQVGENRQQKYPQNTSRIYFRTVFRKHYSEN